MIEEIINKIDSKDKIALIGYGRESKSTYKLIRKYLHNKKLTIIDIRDVSNLEDFQNDTNVDFICGDNYLDNLDQFDLIIKSPGVSFTSIDTSSFKEKITSQLELLLEVYKNNIIGITGTKGKSTTSSLIYSILKDQNYDTYLIGNIGVPVLDNIEFYKENTILVTEMSSHQLEFIKTSPNIGIILNLFQDHLDHTGSLENYHNAKMNMFKFQKENDISIVDKDNEYLKLKLNNNVYESKLLTVSNISKDANIYLDNNKIYIGDKEIIDVNKLKRNILGNHNLKNIMFSLLVSDLLNLDINKALKTISEFQPLEHRMEYVGTYKDIKFYNDTIATIPEATISAIDTLKDVDTLIFGGQDRGIDYSNFIKFLKKSSIRNFICMPSTGNKLGKLIENSNNNIYFINTLEEAVELAYKITSKNKMCLLSPAAPSYEYFKNFEEKGKKYKELIKLLGSN